LPSGGRLRSLPRLNCGLYIRISHPDALPDLVRALSKRAHFVVGAVRTDVVPVGVLGSFADGGQDDLKRFLRAWRVEHPGIETDIEIDDLRAVTVLPIPLPRADINDATFVRS
jgi:hypothetical protein